MSCWLGPWVLSSCVRQVGGVVAWSKQNCVHLQHTPPKSPHHRGSSASHHNSDASFSQTSFSQLTVCLPHQDLLDSHQRSLSVRPPLHRRQQGMSHSARVCHSGAQGLYNKAVGRRAYTFPMGRDDVLHHSPPAMVITTTPTNRQHCWHPHFTASPSAAAAAAAAIT